MNGRIEKPELISLVSQRMNQDPRVVDEIVDAYQEPEPLAPNWPPPDWPETREEYQERLRNTPVHLCRLRYFGDEERWGFAFYTYSNERYELSVFPSGEFLGPPEDAFQVSAQMYLR